MTLDKPSMTMQAVCAARNDHLKLRERDILLAKTAPLLTDAKKYQQQFDSFSKGLFTKTIWFRSLYFSDQMDIAAEEYEQIIILCSGLDFRAITHPIWSKKDKFFIDHPQSLQYSQSVLKQLDYPTTKVKFIGQDVTLVDPEIVKEMLFSNGFNQAKKTLIIWEGASFYFEKTQVYNLLNSFIQNIENIKIVFDYHIKKIPDDSVEEDLKKSLNYAKEHDEQWNSSFIAKELQDYFSNYSFNEIEQMTDITVQQLYFYHSIDDYKPMFGFITAERNSK